MTPRFADAFYYLALISPDDARHTEAAELSESLGGSIVTTAWVLTEVADALSAAAHRGNFLRLLRALREDSDTEVIPPSPELFERGLDLYAQRPDKDWSLTDCVSFVVMRQYGITEALSGDHHFEQAGFTILLK